MLELVVVMLELVNIDDDSDHGGDGYGVSHDGDLETVETVMMIMVKMTMNSQGPPSQEAPPPGHSRGQVSRQSPFSSGSSRCPRSLGAFRPRGHNQYELITTRAHICHKYHKLYLWRKNCHVEKFWEFF